MFGHKHTTKVSNLAAAALYSSDSGIPRSPTVKRVNALAMGLIKRETTPHQQATVLLQFRHGANIHRR